MFYNWLSHLETGWNRIRSCLGPVIDVQANDCEMNICALMISLVPDLKSGFGLSMCVYDCVVISRRSSIFRDSRVVSLNLNADKLMSYLSVVANMDSLMLALCHLMPVSY